MKKIFTIITILSFVACSTDNTENSLSLRSEVKKNTFNPNPTPEDYIAAKYPGFIKEGKVLCNFTSTEAIWVNTYVPDPNFRVALINVGAGRENANPKDNYIDVDISSAFLFVGAANISDLTGIEAFTSLIKLVVGSNKLTTLDISALKNLEFIECQDNQLTTLDLTANTNLRQIWCQENYLTKLKIPSTIDNRLWGLWCYENQLTNLDLNGNTNIVSLFIHKNQLTTFDFTKLTELKMVNCSYNKWETLNFDNNSKLEALWCSNNSLLTDLSIKNNNNHRIINQSFLFNVKRPKIHIDASFLPVVNTYWPHRGSNYQL